MCYFSKKLSKIIPDRSVCAEIDVHNFRIKWTVMGFALSVTTVSCHLPQGGRHNTTPEFNYQKWYFPKLIKPCSKQPQIKKNGRSMNVPTIHPEWNKHKRVCYSGRHVSHFVKQAVCICKDPFNYDICAHRRIHACVNCAAPENDAGLFDEI